jgi:ABC-type branched-subunit amino acid transport system ATPase component
MLNVSGVRAGYRQSGALHGIDFDVAPGEVVIFVDRNGRGKPRS